MLNRVEEELPSMSDVAKVDDIELQEITGNAARSSENLIRQLEGESCDNLPRCKLPGLDKQLRSIQGLLKVEVAEKVQLEEDTEKSVSSRRSITSWTTQMCNEKKSKCTSPI